MRNLFFIAWLCTTLVAAWPMAGYGQNAAPKVELFGGGTKVWGYANGSRFDEGGGEVSATGYFNRVVGLEANWNMFSGEVPNAPAYGTEFSLLFGPHFTYHRSGWVNPFAHVLVGFTRGTAEAPNFSLVHRAVFTIGMGGGVDVKIWRFLWLRPIQLDYLRESFPSVPYPPEPFPSTLENNLQLSAGFTVHVGSLRRNP